MHLDIQWFFCNNMPQPARLTSVTFGQGQNRQQYIQIADML